MFEGMTSPFDLFLFVLLDHIHTSINFPSSISPTIFFGSLILSHTIRQDQTQPQGQSLPY